MSAKGSLEHWASWWGGCWSSLLFQTWLCAHCSLARCAGSSLLVSATNPFIGTKGGNTGLVLLIPHYNVQILGAKLIRMRLCITPITHHKKLHAISVVPLTLQMSIVFVSKCVPSQNLQFNKYHLWLMPPIKMSDCEALYNSLSAAANYALTCFWFMKEDAQWTDCRCWTAVIVY